MNAHFAIKSSTVSKLMASSSLPQSAAMIRHFTCTISTSSPSKRTADILRFAKAHRARTHLVTKTLPPSWTEEHGDLVDVVVVKISSRAEWEDARDAVLEAQHRGITVAVESHFPRGGVQSLADIVACFVPEFWSVTLTEADDMRAFITKNAKWAERIPDVRVSCAQSRAANRLHYRYLDE